MRFEDTQDFKDYVAEKEKEKDILFYPNIILSIICVILFIIGLILQFNIV